MAAGHPRTRTVVVLRHAKAESSAATDHARELTARGRADATAAGELLSEILDPDAETVALVSSAARARQTWELAAAELDVPVEQRDLDELYEAGGDDVVDLLALLPDEIEVAIVVGHNPTMAALAHQLDNGDDEELSARLGERGLPTAAVAVLELDGSWSGLEATSCRLVRLDVGRGG
jgi:phosphohistidine phosphatase